jgi:hypothetical protein
MLTLDSPRDRLIAVAGALAFVPILFVVVPVFDLIATAWPLRPGNLSWRFAASGLLSGFLLTPLLGLALLTALATLRHRPWPYLALALVSGLGSLVLVGLVLLFALDALQLRGSVPPEQKAMFDMSGLRTVVKDVTGALALIVLTVANLRLWRSVGRRRGKAEARSVLVVPGPAEPTRGGTAP